MLLNRRQGRAASDVESSNLSLVPNARSNAGLLISSQLELFPLPPEILRDISSERRAVIEPTEEKLARRRFQKGQLLLIGDRWSVRFYEDAIENGERRRRRVQRFLGTLKELPTKRLAMRAMAAVLSSVNSLAYRPSTTTTFRDYAKRWVETCGTRRRRTIKPSTLRTWESILENHILPILGGTPLSSVDNRAVKDLVEGLVRKKLSAQTIKNIVAVVKLVKSSAVDENGEELYPTKWNHAYIDLPESDSNKTKKPTFDSDQVTSLVRSATGRIQMAVILLAASGLRAGELLGLEVSHFDGNAVAVEQTVWGGKISTPKTTNSYRTVDLHPDVAALLERFIGERTTGFIFQTSGGKPVTQTNLLRREFHPLLEDLGISKRGFHCFRRFRNTYLRKSNCPDGLLKFWMGHAGRSMSDTYDRVQEDLKFRREMSLFMGVGFDLPNVLSPKVPKPRKSPRRVLVSGVIGRQQETQAAVNR
jgi:integrase